MPSNGYMKRPVLYVMTFFCAGIICQRLTGLSIFYSLPASLVFLALSVIFLKKDLPSHIYLYAAILLLAMAYYQNSIELGPDHISRFISGEEGEVVLEGVIVDDPVTRPAFYKKMKTTFLLRAGSYVRPTGAVRVSGKVRVDLYSEKVPPLSYGDEIVVKGILSSPKSFRNPGTFDYPGYLRTKGIYAVMRVGDGSLAKTGKIVNVGFFKKTAYSLRQKISDIIDRNIPPYYGGLLKGVLIGDRSGLSDEISGDFEKTGTFHVLAISGLHAGLIAALSLFVFGLLGLPRKLNLAATAFVLIFYSLLAGSNPPIVRATIIYLIFVAGYLIDRDSDILNSLSCAALIILLWNPREIFGASFQLSFLSVASIVLFSPKIDAMLQRLTNKDFNNTAPVMYIRKGVAVSLSAWLGVWPIVASYFNIVSPIAIAVNLVVIPLLFLSIGGSIIFVLASLVADSAGIFISYLLILIEKTLFNINHFFAQLPFAYFRTSSPSIVFMFFYYSALAVLIMPDALVFGKIRVLRKRLIIMLLVLFNILIWAGNIDFDEKVLRVTFFAVGKADSALVEFPGGGKMLIDTASGGDGRMDMAESVIAPYLWNKGIFKIDALVISHFHEDHVGGSSYILENFKVGCAIDSGGETKNSVLYERYNALVRDKRIRHLKIGKGEVVRSFGAAQLFALNPPRDAPFPDPNNNSVVLKLTHGGASVLFCGDIEEKAMDNIIYNYEVFLKSDILKIPHHSGPKYPGKIFLKFLESVSPKVSIFSVGKRIPSDKPSERVLRKLTDLNSISYSTAEDGAIVITKGEGPWRIITYDSNNN